ncbi:SCP2 sterol-binding domain-containing protein [Metabacillus litoralis]|uniref:SCP2 sterol-binding domain-containing protein n=1 Tax=Metabacillus litoralis TaxID=152268 RepID=UPI001CFE3FB6|nr:SCP2 sterol-binding domain-containing protein [Metabacillus litoralis]
MNINTFIENINRKKYVLSTLLKQAFTMEIKSTQNNLTHYIEFTSNGAKVVKTIPINVDFYIEGSESYIDDVLMNKTSLKQMISFGEIKIKGSYRSFLKVDAMLKLS